MQLISVKCRTCGNDTPARPRLKTMQFCSPKCQGEPPKCKADGCETVCAKNASNHYLAYCSDSCKNSKKSPADPKVCKLCDKEFCKKENESRRDYDNKKFCSIECRKLSVVAKSTRKQVKITRNCCHCKKEFLVRKSDIQRFCNPKCSTNFYNIFMSDSAMSQEEIAVRLGISVAQVKYHEAKAMNKLADVFSKSPVIMEYFQ